MTQVNDITRSSSFFYLGLSIIVLINCILTERSKDKNILFVIANTIILSFVAGFRAYTVGRDTLGYAAFFYNPEGSITALKDPVFACICKILMWIYPNPTFLFLVYAVVIYGLIGIRLWELNKNTSYTISFMTFYSLYFFETMNALRQFVAVAIVFYATRYLFSKKYFIYILFVLISMAFHITAVIGLTAFLPELFDWRNLSKSKRRFFVTLILIGLILGLYTVYSGELALKMDPYIHYFRQITYDVSYRMILVLLILIVSSIMYKNSIFIITNNQRQCLMKTIKVFVLLGGLLGLISFFARFVGRLCYYYALFFGVYFGIVACEKRPLRRLIIRAPILFLILYSLINYIWFINGGNQHPYHFVWEG